MDRAISRTLTCPSFAWPTLFFASLVWFGQIWIIRVGSRREESGLIWIVLDLLPSVTGIADKVLHWSKKVLWPLHCTDMVNNLVSDCLYQIPSVQLAVLVLSSILDYIGTDRTRQVRTGRCRAGLDRTSRCRILTYTPYAVHNLHEWNRKKYNLL